MNSPLLKSTGLGESNTSHTHCLLIRLTPELPRGSAAHVTALIRKWSNCALGLGDRQVPAIALETMLLCRVNLAKLSLLLLLTNMF